MSGQYGTLHFPTEIRLKKAERVLEVDFDDGSRFVLPAEYPRVESPSAEVQGHGPGDKTIVETPLDHPQGMSVSGLLKSEYFGLRSTVDGETRRRLDRRNLLYAKSNERTPQEDEEMSRLSHELSELGFANDFKDPMYDLFVKRMAKMTQFHKDALTPDEHAAQDAAADEIIRRILAEEKSA